MTLDEIIRRSRFEPSKQHETSSLEVVPGVDLPRTDALDTLDGLNALCREMDFPVIEERMLDNHLVLIDVLNNLNIEYGRYGLSFSSDLEEMRRRQEQISACNGLERECDVLEVELANLKDEHCRMRECSQHDIEDLKTRLGGLKRAFGDMEYERAHSDIINRVLRFLRGGAADEFVLASLGYMKSTREFSNIVEKMRIVEEIESTPHSHDKSIFRRLVFEEFVALDDLGRLLRLDRTALLKTVYSLLSRNVIVFNRSQDTISLQR